jgi:Domain of unknown function (DUF4398)
VGSRREAEQMIQGIRPTDGHRAKLRPIRWLAALGACALLAGCGNTLYAIQANAAANKLEEAKELGAEKLAPYEYYFAKEHLDKAMSEAGEADYGDAIDLANVAEEFADKAIRLSRDAHRGAGR